MSALLLHLTVAAVALLSLTTGCDKVIYSEKTRYSLGFNERRFNAITTGISEEEVIGQLGLPLSKTTQDPSEIWLYGTPPSQRPGFEGAAEALHTSIRFSTNGVVISTAGKPLAFDARGLTADTVLARMGRPDRRDSRPFTLIYHYTQPASQGGGGGTYYRREVHFDQNRKVTATIAAICYD